MHTVSDSFPNQPGSEIRIRLSPKEKTIELLKKGIWAYFLLIIFEGAIRKWVLPGLATPLLIIRDPIGLWLVFTAWNRGLLPSTFYLKGAIVVGVLSIFTALAFGHGNLFVALFGARMLLLNFPLVFVMGRVFDREEILKLGRAVLWISLPMIVLIGLQFYSPQSAWVNRGVGGDKAGGGFSGAEGFFRPPGTFSFTTGVTSFFNIAVVFVLYFWISGKQVNRLLLLASTCAIVMAIPFSMSRGYFFQLMVSAFFFLVASLRKPENLGKIILGIIVLATVLGLLSQTALFTKITKPILSRFDNAASAEGGVKGTLGTRFLGGMGIAIANSFDQPFFGYGTGMGTNVGSTLLAGKISYLISEEEWGRLLGELGPFMGLIIVFIRVGLVIKIALAAIARMSRNDMLPWLLLAYGSLILAEGQWSQPTSLGFSVIMGGLMLAAVKVFPDN